MTSLEVYAVNSASGTLTTAAKFVTVNGGTDQKNTTKIGTSTGYGEVVVLGTTSAWGAAGSIGSPSGNGALWDVTTLEGNQIIAGNWTPAVKFLVSVGSIVADVYIRAYVYNSGTYTQIGSTMLLSGQTINTTYTIYTFSATSQPAQNFYLGDKLYCDCWLNITSNSTGSGTATLSFGVGSGSTTGVGNHFDIPTPGYQSIPSPLRMMDGTGGVFS